MFVFVVPLVDFYKNDKTNSLLPCNLEEQGVFPSNFLQMFVFVVPLVDFYKNDKTNSLFDTPHGFVVKKDYHQTIYETMGGFIEFYQNLALLWT